MTSRGIACSFSTSTVDDEPYNCPSTLSSRLLRMSYQHKHKIKDGETTHVILKGRFRRKCVDVPTRGKRSCSSQLICSKNGSERVVLRTLTTLTSSSSSELTRLITSEGGSRFLFCTDGVREAVRREEDRGRSQGIYALLRGVVGTDRNPGLRRAGFSSSIKCRETSCSFFTATPITSCFTSCFIVGFLSSSFIFSFLSSS